MLALTMLFTQNYLYLWVEAPYTPPQKNWPLKKWAQPTALAWVLTDLDRNPLKEVFFPEFNLDALQAFEDSYELENQHIALRKEWTENILYLERIQAGLVTEDDWEEHPWDDFIPGSAWIDPSEEQVPTALNPLEALRFLAQDLKLNPPGESALERAHKLLEIDRLVKAQL